MLFNAEGAIVTVVNYGMRKEERKLAELKKSLNDEDKKLLKEIEMKEMNVEEKN